MSHRHPYKNLPPEKLQELFSNYLVDSWSFSKISDFSRNEKSFEMSHIYGNRGKSGASMVAGNAYHYALRSYFEAIKAGSEKQDLPTLEMIAYDYIDAIGANQWKIQKTTPTIEACKQKADELAGKLLKNFFSELSIYENNISEVLHVELYCDEFLTVNGVDIPLPCHAIIDLVIKTPEGKTVIIDHKSKAAFSDEEELKLFIGRQAITYVKCYEEKTGEKIDEVWFYENKHSQNKNGTPQINCFKISLNKDVRALYEALLYEPLKRMIEAVSNPDYVYLINDSDNFIDKAELYEFWAKTMIAEVGDFNVADSKKELVSKRLKKIRDTSLVSANPKIIKEFKQNASAFIQYDLTNKNMTQEEKIEHILRSFGTAVRVAHKFDGYSSNTYLLEISAGVKIASIYSHRLDIANVLDVSSVRIPANLVVHENKSYLAIETAKKRERDLIFDEKLLSGQRIPIGKNNSDELIVWDLENHSTPHALICGATGSGKSVCLNSIIEYSKLAGVDSIVILDPKFEFTRHNGANIEVHNDIDDIETIMEMLVEEMNMLVKSGRTKRTMIFFDEFADAVAASKKGNELNVYEDVVVGMTKTGKAKTERTLIKTKKSLEENLKILLQKGRSIGFRIVAATQRASVKVITGDAKVNFPVQICFRVPKEIDSKVVLDEAGAESLAGRGDGLMRSPEYNDIVRFQAFYKP